MQIAIYPGPAIIALLFGIPVFLLCFQYPLFGLMLIVIVLPVRSLDYSFTLGSTIIRFSQLLAVPTGIGWLLHILLTQKDQPVLEKTPLNQILYLFTFIMLISLIWGINIGGWISKNIQWALSMLLFFMSVNLIKNRELVKRFAMIWIVVGTLVSIGAIVQFLTGGIDFLIKSEQQISWGQVRSESILKEPNDLVKYLTCCLLFAIAYFETLSEPRKKLLLIVCQAMIVGGVLCTFSRGATLSLALGMGIMFLRFIRLRSLFLWGCIAVILVTIISGKASTVTSIVMERLLSSFDFLSSEAKAAEDIGYVVRIQNWAAGIKIFFDHPILGIGLGGYGKVVGSMIPGEVAESPYSLYLDILVSLGLIGFTVFIAFMLSSIYNCFKIASRLKDRFLSNILYAGGVILVIKLFKGITGEVFIESMYMWLAIGLAMAALKVSENERP